MDRNQGGLNKKSQISEGGGGSRNLGTVPKLYLVINYDGLPSHMVYQKYNICIQFNSELFFITATHSRATYMAVGFILYQPSSVT